MSPASSVCSDGSTILFSSSTSGNSNNGGNRSLTTTPTSTMSSSSTSSISSVSAPAAATTTKVSSSPSQGQGQSDQFVWPSPPLTLHQTVSNLSSSTANIPQPILPQLSPVSNPTNGTFWLSPANSLATLSTGQFVSSGSNSLTLNYVQSPNNINTGNCVSSANIISNIGAISLASSVPSTLVTTASTTATTSVPTPTTTATVTGTAVTTGGTSATKKPYQLFQKNVRRPSSPCPNIDVRQLPLEQNRPPPITPSPVLPTSTSIISSKLSPLAPTTPTNISATINNATATTITSLPTLPVVTNPNILFTVAPPLVATNKTEIVSLSTPTLPILPLLTTTGKLPTVGSIDTTCGAPTIVTTLQPNANIFGTIDANALFPAGNQNRQNPAVISISSKPAIVQQSSTVKADSNSTDTKKNDENSKTDKEASNSGKSQGKDGKDNKTTKDGDKCPLQLAQDILNRFEKKSGDKNAETGSSKSNGSNNNNENVGNAKKINSTTASTTPFSKVGGEEKAREKGNPTTKTSKSTKDGNKTEEKSNKNEVAAAAVAKIDSSSLSSSSNSTLTTTKAAEMGSTKHNETGANKNSSGVTTESKLGRATSSTADIVILHQTTDDKTKLPIDSSKHSINVMSSILPATSINATVSLNSIVCSTNSVTTQLPQLAENTIITSQTPVMSTTPLILKDGLQLTEQGLTLTTSVSGSIPTISLSAMGNQIIQTSCAPVPCSNTLTAGGLGTFGTATTNQFILQPSHASSDPANGANQTFITTSTGPGGGQLRYPFFQSIQPLFLNSTGHAGGPLIISQPTQSSQDHNQGNPTITQQSFIYDQNGTPTATIDATGAFQSMLQPTTMVLDPSMCAGNANMAGGKKKKKRLSKKQQQQQAQLQLQQQFILQQIQAQQQQAAAAAIAPLTIFPQSFNLGPQGFSLQPTMNFFQTPTILTLPNLILNPADGTLFIQPSTPLPTATTAPMQQTMKLGQFPLTTSTQMPQNPQNIAPKKDGTGTTIIQNLMEPLKPSTTPGLDPGSDDSRQNPTPDSSTNDLQLGLINVATGPTQGTNTITLNIPAQTTTTVLHNNSPVMNKKNSKSRTVSSSSTTMKRILPQKQILPKIDSTTPSTTENAN